MRPLKHPFSVVKPKKPFGRKSMSLKEAMGEGPKHEQTEGPMMRKKEKMFGG